MLQNILQAFAAANINGMSRIAYTLQTNVWFLLIIGAALVSIVMNLKDEVENTVREEQNVL